MTDGAYDLVIAGGRVVTPSGLVETSLGIKGGKIAALGDLSSAKEIGRAHV